MTASEVAQLIEARDQFVTAWCLRHGKSRDELTMDDILAIRSEPGWKHPHPIPKDGAA